MQKRTIVAVLLSCFLSACNGGKTKISFDSNTDAGSNNGGTGASVSGSITRSFEDEIEIAHIEFGTSCSGKLLAPDTVLPSSNCDLTNKESSILVTDNAAFEIDEIVVENGLTVVKSKELAAQLSEDELADYGLHY